MSSGETTVVILFLILVIIGAVALTRWAPKSFRRSSSPEHSKQAVPASGWRRFCAALAAPYVRPEWNDGDEAQSIVASEQAYFSYASGRSQRTVLALLRTDWGVKNERDALEQLENGIAIITNKAAQIFAFRGGTVSEVEELATAIESHGAPRQISADFAVRVREQVVQLHGPAAPQTDNGFDVPGLIFDIARIANLIRLSAFVGLITPRQADSYGDVLGMSASAVVGNWEEFGSAYVDNLNTQLRSFSTPFFEAVDWLSSDSASPWKRQEWITNSSLDL